MEIKIGGEMEISMHSITKSPSKNNGLPLRKMNHVWVDTGRSALYVALQEIIQSGSKKEAWLPSYCCDSVVAPFVQLGFTLQFYSMGIDLQSPSHLPDSLENIVFLYINYFGKQNKQIVNWLKQNKVNSTVIIEDNVQAAFSENVGEVGDYVLYSLRKFLPQPDGALLAYEGEAIKAHLLNPDEHFISEKVIGKMLRGAGGDADIFLTLFADSEERIDSQNIQPRKMSTFSRFLFERTDLGEIKRARKRNWDLLNNALKRIDSDQKGFYPLFESLEEKEVPLGYPIFVKYKKRDLLRKYLASHQIFCPVHWPIPTDRAGDADLELSRSILTLPIDQRVSSTEILYLVDKMKCFFEEVAHS